MESIARLLRALSVSPNAEAVYLSLLRHGGSTARLIAERLSMTRPSVYDQLKTLIKLGLVSEKSVDGKTEFIISDIDDLEHLAKKKEEELAELRQNVAETKKELGRRLSTTEPKIKFITGKEAILQAMHDMLWDDRVVLQAFWPYESMLEALGAENLRLFNEKRIRQGLHLETIWPAPKKIKNHIWAGGDWGVERRIGPASLSAPMGYTIYDDKVLFISSARETFGFVVTSHEFATLMRAQFSCLWAASKPIKKERAA